MEERKPDLIQAARDMLEACIHVACTLEDRHHGAHVSESGRRWWDPIHYWYGHSPSTCAECGADEDREVTRIQAGGKLRPGQFAPKWLREGRPPPPRRTLGVTRTTRGGGRKSWSRRAIAAEGA